MNVSTPFAFSKQETAASFWPVSLRALLHTELPRASSASNLYDLFVSDVSLLVSGACEIDRQARSLFSSLEPEQIGMRRLVLGLAKSARGCLPALPPALAAEGIDLSPVRDTVVECLLGPLQQPTRADCVIEPASVGCVRKVSAFTQLAAHFQTQAAQAAQDAWLLGSDRLNVAFTAWAAEWGVYLRDLQRWNKRYRSQAYGAGMEGQPIWQTA